VSLRAFITQLLRVEPVKSVPEKAGGMPAPLEVVVTETSDDQVLDIMVAEAADLTKAMREFLMTCDRYVYFGGLLAAAAFTVGVLRHDDGNNWLVLVFAPYALGLSFMYLVQIFTEIERRAGHKKFLEERIRAMVRFPVLLEADVADWHVRSRPSTWGGQALNTAVLLAFVCLSAKETFRFHAAGPGVFGVHLINYFVLNLLFLVALIVVLALALVENMRAAGLAYEAARSAWERRLGAPGS
jgi:hypothetical protein